jgi:hypothetical protein
MLREPLRRLIDSEDAFYYRPDIFSRMSDVELLAELRCITSLAIRREDAGAAEEARELFAAFYEQRTHGRVSDMLWDTTRAFVRQHATTQFRDPAAQQM